MRRLSSIFAIALLMGLSACGGDSVSVQEEPQMKIQTRDRTPSKPKAEKPTANAEEDAMNNKGIGPVEKVDLGDIDQGLVAEGESLFAKNCTACHKVDKRYIGPAIEGVTERRTPEWIMNMIVNPTEMIQKDPLAKQMVSEFNGAVMADQNITEEQARAILEYFRTL